MDYVKSFRDLEVCKLSRQLAKEIFEISKTFPKEEMYSLTIKSGGLPGQSEGR
jgi:hypothetical protein